MRTATWLAREADLPVGSCRQRVDVADKLRRHLPTVDRELTDGSIGWDQARTLADAANPRIRDRFDGVVPALVAAVPGARFDRWRRDVARVADLLDDDGPEPAPPRPDRLTFSPTDGSIGVRAEYHGPEGEALRQSVEARADELFHRFRSDAERTGGEIAVPRRAELRALALAELVRHGLARPAGDTTPPRVEVSLVLGPPPDDGIPAPVPSPSPAPAPTGGAELTGPTGGRLDAPMFDHLPCAPTVHAIVLDGLGVPLELGRDRRLATREQRRALARRDGGCVFPGCDAPATWTDAHHILPWDDLGPTDVDNLASLCRRHHGVTHRTGWRMQRTDDGWFWWTTPGGTTFWSQRHGRQRAGPAPPDAGVSRR